MKGVILFLVGHEAIGTTRTGHDGRFILTTSTGYATKLDAISPDMRQSGTADISRKHTSTNIYVSPEFRWIRYRAIDPLSPETEKTAAAMKAIMKEIIRNGGRLESLTEYMRRGTITDEQFNLFVRNPGLYFGEDPEAKYRWGDQTFLIKDERSNVRLVADKKK